MALSNMSNLSSPDRVVKLEVIDNKLPKTSTGMVDTGLITGENNLHARIDPQSMMWTLHYEKGAVPGALKDQKWTSFSKLYKDLELYFKTRNIKITEVVQSR